jgi:hypothetical protein
VRSWPFFTTWLRTKIWSTAWTLNLTAAHVQHSSPYNCYWGSKAAPFALVHIDGTTPLPVILFAEPSYSTERCVQTQPPYSKCFRICKAVCNGYRGSTNRRWSRAGKTLLHLAHVETTCSGSDVRRDSLDTCSGTASGRPERSRYSRVAPRIAPQL